ncbi:uncharacterized protein PSFLO_01455 [Pseudozyma flocculosa]|uniref:Uncharacterized protein n=2 Tax=Pseudozyma flocculosa TaxID=84751 RepID=A0A5C3EUG8_9BASI|nr:uncharacterized protein PSFLO_01455 [Pseudozyma flocculosa]
MSGQTTDQSFKKTHQTVGANGNDVVDNLNEHIMKTAPGHDGNVAAEEKGELRPRSERIERDLREKGYTTKSSDQEMEEHDELKQKLDKRGNPAQ